MGMRDLGEAPHSTGQEPPLWWANWSAGSQWHPVEAAEAAASERTGWAVAPQLSLNKLGQ